MVKQIGTMITAITLVIATTGCSGMKNFLFGRGAQCGLCNKLGGCLPRPQFGNMMQAPTCQSTNPGIVAAPPCGCQDYAGQGYQSDEYASGKCECGTAHGGYAPGETVDPYLSSPQMYDSGTTYPQGVPTQTYPGTTYPSQTYPGAPIQGDGFQARKFDSDGNKILWEEPLPAGATGR